MANVSWHRNWVRRAPKRLRQAAIVVTAVSTLTAGVTYALASSASRSPQDRDPVQFAPSRGSVPLVAGTPSEVVTTLAARLPLVSNVRVVIESIPTSDTGPTTEQPVLEYDLHVPAFDGSAITEALWEGSVLTGAVVDEFGARGFGLIAEARGTLVDPNGARELVGGGIGRVVRDQVFDTPPASFGDDVSASGVQFGLRDVRVSSVRGLQDAVVIFATSDEPERVVQELSQPSAIESLLGGPATRFEGSYLEVRDSSGNPIYITATAPRDGSATFWTRASVGISGRGRLENPSP